MRAAPIERAARRRDAIDDVKDKADDLVDKVKDKVNDKGDRD